jgi:hypothetical protein
MPELSDIGRQVVVARKVRTSTHLQPAQWAPDDDSFIIALEQGCLDNDFVSLRLAIKGKRPDAWVKADQRLGMGGSLIEHCRFKVHGLRRTRAL